MQVKLLDPENQGAADIQSGTAQSESWCQWARLKVSVFEGLLFLTGRLPYHILKLTSLPWCLIPCFAPTFSWEAERGHVSLQTLQREFPSQELEDLVRNLIKAKFEHPDDQHRAWSVWLNDYMYSRGSSLRTTSEISSQVYKVCEEIRADTRRFLHIFSNLLFWTSLGSVLNSVFLIVFLRCNSIKLTGYKVLPITYMFSFAVAALFRALLREKYGDYSRTGEWIDRQMLAAFGIYLIHRGNASQWIYPVLSIAPAAVVWSIVRWFQKADFLVRCKKAAHEELVFDQEHCALDDDVSNYFQMAPFIISQLLLIYGITKAFAAFMVKADPEARGTLSEMHAWSIKMGSEPE